MPKPLILIADDEELLRELYAELLQPHYEIVLARNGTEARENALSLPGLCGILMDVQMPGVNGLQVAREVLSRRPEVRIIIMSGTDVTYRVRQMFASERVAFLVKPFELEALVSLVSRMFHFQPPE
ncbi:response regulator [Chloracidobacterium sp. MS 40/45]|jgi:CheY-like chemotaxis protein|uniref:response regulator n=1 Tax=Chloracidobacterium aggregatum TaxID=2851959 RepID=UPI001B8C5524|nr:response regulator [Chloracidobacterium aggregatum]QUV99858.1 response regulator [Chloracidobacterium sp. MS 40/45]